MIKHTNDLQSTNHHVRVWLEKVFLEILEEPWDDLFTLDVRGEVPEIFLHQGASPSRPDDAEGGKHLNLWKWLWWILETLEKDMIL